MDVTDVKQLISGFGASSAWTAQSLNDIEADLFFSPQTGIGLSLLRLRISPEGTTVENSAALKAHERGVGVWAAPWSPPGTWKTNGDPENGGSLLPERYQDWADRLANFAAAKQAQGIPLVALSAQNEPDWVAEWETCSWTPAQLATFIRDNLGPAVREKAPGTPIMAPESANWNSLASYGDAILDDPAAADEVSIIAVHSYGGTPYPYAAPHEKGKLFWETEISYHDPPTLDKTIFTAVQVHEHLTVANVNAYHYWWLKGSTSALLVDGVLMPQAYAIGHFAKFVRPGYFRVGTSNPTPDVRLSAYHSVSDGRVVIIAINESQEDIAQPIEFVGAEPLTVTPWLTNADVTLRELDRYAVDNPLELVLPARSIVSVLVTVVPEDEQPGPSGAGGAAGAPGTETISSTNATVASTTGSGGTDAASATSGDATTSRNTTTSRGTTSRGTTSGDSAATNTNAGGASSVSSGSNGTEASSDGRSEPVAVSKAPNAVCICGLVGHRTSGSGWLWGLAALGLMATRRRRWTA